ncbi:TPA: hypothetical protein N0F65_004319 [Lagenidium giganteum]|uniref:DNL-type domain-containing protein n=1 Tax=Lagenidium giganteum TaxID=4803 RepID=A0AAV2Z9V2_9STRA|nr:TPA: hypothetical protein N0F65_004319 [Lagenidium giganteum]
MAAASSIKTAMRALLRATTSKQVQQITTRRLQTQAVRRTWLVQAARSRFHHGGRPFCREFSIVPSSSDDANANASSSFVDAPGVKQSGDKFVMLYTCSVCETRAAKTISKHAYTKGVVLVRCPGCENLHLIADHLGWFEDDAADVESLLRQKGEEVRVVSADNVLELTEQDILGRSKFTESPAEPGDQK